MRAKPAQKMVKRSERDWRLDETSLEGAAGSVGMTTTPGAPGVGSSEDEEAMALSLTSFIVAVVGIFMMMPVTVLCVRMNMLMIGVFRVKPGNQSGSKGSDDDDDEMK